MRGGLFVTFEGGEGSGKTTQLSLLKGYLEAHGLPVVCTREPGGTIVGNAIRTLLLDPKSPPMNAHAELLAYLASRAQHVHEVILPALRHKKIVLCDRFTDSTIAYQGYGRGLPITEIIRMARFASLGVVPDITFLLEMDVSAALGRVKTRGRMSRLDQASVAFHKAVHLGYLCLAKRNTRRIHVIHADASMEAIRSNIQKIIDTRLP